MRVKYSFPTTFSFLAACLTRHHQAEAAKCGDFFYNSCSDTNDPRYDPDASTNLKDQDLIYSKLEGFWTGEFVFYDGKGEVMPSSLYDEKMGFGWPYDYSSYRGAINITVDGSRFMQHNYFFYPPASVEFCAENVNPPSGKANVYGSGVCGVNGGFKSFDAFGTSAHEKDGTMISLPAAGTYADFVNINRPIDNNTLLYTSTDKKTQFHSQMNVFYPDENHRTRTAYGFDYNLPGQQSALMYSSLYRETKVTEEEFLKALKDYGTLYNVSAGDIATYPMKKSCLQGDWAGGRTVCPDEKAWCAIDPNCSKSPYKPEKDTLNATTVSLFVAAAAVIMIVALVIMDRIRIKNAKFVVRTKFANALKDSSDWTSTHTPKLLFELFQKIDTNEDQIISRNELSEFMKKDGVMSEKECEKLFETLDKDRNNEIDFAEFCAFYTKPVFAVKKDEKGPEDEA